MSTKRIYDAVVGVCARRLAQAGGEHLDIGAGSGELIRQLRDALAVNSRACDCHPERFAAGEASCTRVDLDREPLPYPDSRFDLVTCSEVVEHVENFRALLREAYRVTKPGGLLVVTTPNVLNLVSRFRYFCCGFAGLFGPLPVRNERRDTTHGHISPIAYFYLAHALLDAGFEDLRLDTDKLQGRSFLLLLLAFPLLLPGWHYFKGRERWRYRTLTAETERHFGTHFSLPVLAGRTLVVSAVKPRA